MFIFKCTNGFWYHKQNVTEILLKILFFCFCSICAKPYCSSVLMRHSTHPLVSRYILITMKNFIYLKPVYFISHCIVVCIYLLCVNHKRNILVITAFITISGLYSLFDWKYEKTLTNKFRSTWYPKLHLNSFEIWNSYTFPV